MRSVGSSVPLLSKLVALIRPSAAEVRGAPSSPGAPQVCAAACSEVGASPRRRRGRGVLLNLSVGGVGDGVASQGLGVYTRCVHSDLL
jgi:hypothetical protein